MLLKKYNYIVPSLLPISEKSRQRIAPFALLLRNLMAMQGLCDHECLLFKKLEYILSLNLQLMSRAYAIFGWEEKILTNQFACNGR